MPTVAPKTPRETSVGFASEPSRVFILYICEDFAVDIGRVSGSYQPLTASTSIP